jgi:hypothetical protein
MTGRTWTFATLALVALAGRAAALAEDDPPSPPAPAAKPEGEHRPSARPATEAPRRRPRYLSNLMEPGSSLRYRCTVVQHVSTARVDRPEAVAGVESKQEAVLRVTCVGTTKIERIYDVTVEGYRVWAAGSDGRLQEVDLSAAAPAKDDPRADVYERHRPLLGQTLRVNTEPMGLVREATGAVEARNAKAAVAFWPFVHPEVMKGTLGPIFSIKTDAPAPESADPWYVKVPVTAGTSRTEVWETRALTAVAGDVATVTGKVAAKGDLDDQERAGQPVRFKEISATAEYAWDTGAKRLASAKRSVTVVSREERMGVRVESTATTDTTLELLPDDKPAPAPAAPAPAGPAKGSP